jgi:ATP-binding cassette subfamily B protein
MNFMLKRLMKSVREYKRDSILTPIMMTFEVVMDVIIPILMAKIIDNGIEPGDMNYIWKMGSILIIAAAASFLFGVSSGKLAARASAGFAKNLRHDMYYNIQNFSFSNIDKFSTASLITRMTTDVTNVQNAYQMVIRMLARAPMMLILAMIMTFNINVRLGFIFVFVVPILAVGLFGIAIKVHPIFVRVFRRYDNLNTVVEENVRSIRVVKSFVNEDYENEKFHERSTDIYNNFVKAEKMLAFNNPLMQLCIYTCILLISWLGAKMIVSRTMTTGEMMSIFAYTMQILNSLMMISMVFVMIIISRTSANRIVEVLEEESDLRNSNNPIFSVKDGSVEFDHVDFSYIKDENKLCLKDINISINSGEVVGIMGGTGSAKTTLIHLIPRLYDVTGGSVKIGGIDVRDYDMDTLRNEVAVVLQKNVLFSGTIKDNLRWGNEDASDEELIRACEIAQADDFIRSFPEGYDTYIEQGGSNISGGQKQRLCIARALLKEPKILILDDSTSAVDTKTDALIRKALRTEIPNTTKIIIAQRISSVEDADKIIILNDGRIDGIGTSEELLKTNRIYQEIYNSQIKGALYDGK